MVEIETSQNKFYAFIKIVNVEKFGVGVEFRIKL